MRLSDAMALGRVILKPAAGGRVNPGEGCALQMAIAAEGRGLPWKYAHQIWPWLSTTHPKFGQSYLSLIWQMFDLQVMASDFDLKFRRLERVTFDQLIDQVRAWEPAEAAPSPEQAIAESCVNAEVGTKA